MDRVLVVSARMGAGHDGAARELARRMGLRGVEATVIDIFDCMPKPLATFWVGAYHWQMRLAPESYERTYTSYYRDAVGWERTLRFFVRMARKRLLAAIAEHRADAVVSTYALANSILGELRLEGAVDVPLVNVITDFGVHPRIVHRGADLNLTPHPLAASAAAALAPIPTLAPGPAVRPEVGERLPDRDAARSWLGIHPEEDVVLVLAGSWGIGDVDHTARTLVSTGRYRVVVACGRHEGLRRRVAKAGAIALGWTDRMPDLLAAADVVIENAGGLSAFEAFAAGRPVVTHQVIPGHGRENARVMDAAGVTTVTDTEDDLVAAVDLLLERGPVHAAQVAAGFACFDHDPADDVLAAVALVRT